MTPRTEQMLKDSAAYLDLHIEYVAELPDNVCGFLEPGPDPRYVFINARKPHSDQAFTIAHELAHYVLHFDRPPRNIQPWYLNIQWKSERMSKFSQKINRSVRRGCGREFQADLWAFLLLWRIGAADDLIAIAEIYPKKRPLFWLTRAGVICFGMTRIIKSFFRRLFNPFWPQ